MIKKISVHNVASYINKVVLETDKKVNLIYGLNGTGKSTFSQFLYQSQHFSQSTYLDFKDCFLENPDNTEICVYNNQFIIDYFYTPDSLAGIFTLSKENKTAEQNIKNAQDEIEKLNVQKQQIIEEDDENIDRFKQKYSNVEKKIWSIKTTYTGGDRVLEYCLDGLKKQKDKLFEYIISITCPKERPQITVEDLKKDVEAIQGDNAKKYDLLSKINFDFDYIESSDIFAREIVGNKNSTIAALIEKLGNSDWVKQGLSYLSDNISKNSSECPFCQEKTITVELQKKIKDFFDESYENDIKTLNQFIAEYKKAAENINRKEIYKLNPLLNSSEFENFYNKLITLIDKNISLMTTKLQSPSQPVNLLDSSNAVKECNNFIEAINIKIKEHNNKIDNKTITLQNIKDQFWSIMRWEYDKEISSYFAEKEKFDKKNEEIKKTKESIAENIKNQEKIIADEQSKTVNIEEAIEHINVGLIELGIDGFAIAKSEHKAGFYQLKRNSEVKDAFISLSEGEKMIISFLYFRELCKGKSAAKSIVRKKIAVIDDPVSSLSHIYMFNIGRMIKKDFFDSDTIEQVFLLTHSLYFFYEMTELNHKKRNETQNLYRLIKNSEGTHLNKMQYEEIQNDYQSYWSVVKDKTQPTALIANCMRNIIEYFFNFIEKTDLNNLFQKPKLQLTKYQAFYRYINRESHSLGQNIFDFKEFNYDDFREAFMLVFAESGYIDHYKKMIQ